MAAFNNFIQDAGLSEYKMGGRRFTWMSDDGCHMSKIDRFLVCKNFADNWPTASVTALPRDMLDHCPLVFSTSKRHYGPTPFKFFNSWLCCADLSDRARCIDFVEAERLRLSRLIDEIEVRAEVAGISAIDRETRANCKKNILDLKAKKNLDLRQKAKVRWDAEGDENSKFFHGVVNGNIKRSTVNGISINGKWETNYDLVKEGFFNFFLRNLRNHLWRDQS
ncbi:uncharacterized protein LOC143602349 [Bidens hawaiensis]|uniref:uncharacterized protein LOC143602349 n=1 Tax=Bidens hawaiensis TaxID=980011 RepID=UPI00404AD50B